MKPVLRITTFGEKVVREALHKAKLPLTLLQQIVQAVNFDLQEHADAKLKPVQGGNREYTIPFPDLGVRVVFELEPHRDGDLTILDFRVVPFRKRPAVGSDQS